MPIFQAGNASFEKAIVLLCGLFFSNLRQVFFQDLVPVQFRHLVEEREVIFYLAPQPHESRETLIDADYVGLALFFFFNFPPMFCLCTSKF